MINYKIGDVLRVIHASVTFLAIPAVRKELTIGTDFEIIEPSNVYKDAWFVKTLAGHSYDYGHVYRSELSLCEKSPKKEKKMFEYDVTNGTGHTEIRFEAQSGYSGDIKVKLLDSIGRVKASCTIGRSDALALGHKLWEWGDSKIDLVYIEDRICALRKMYQSRQNEQHDEDEDWLQNEIASIHEFIENWAGVEFVSEFVYEDMLKCIKGDLSINEMIEIPYEK